MANPQSEEGHTRISNELLEAVLRRSFTGQELKVIFYAARETYGWSRTKAQISYGMISRFTGISRRNAIRICKSLQRRGVLFFQGSGDRYAHIMGIQKNYDLWDRVVDNLVTPRPLASSMASDTQTTRGGDTQTTSKHPTGDTQTTRSGDTQTTPSKQKTNRLKQAENKGRLRNNSGLKAKLAALIKGLEACITNCDPRPVVDALVGSGNGFDVERVWGALVQSRTAANPAGYLVSLLAAPQFSVADSAREKAKEEIKRWKYLESASREGAALVSAVAQKLSAEK